MTTLIETSIAPDAPDAAFDLLSAQLQRAAGIHERTDGGSAPSAISEDAPKLSKDPEALADSVFEAISDDGYGAFDHAVPALAETLGDAGLSRLKALAEAAWKRR
ncbi:hypothetical protein Q4543_23675 [Salipiger sp. 1_MG-2023]|nr:DUF6880 family protein [Salipiger sp. 1_MG-2023]MDO6588483.1 hypothetical protein [Salipiger sp. 1_MG-2023]